MSAEDRFVAKLQVELPNAFAQAVAQEMQRIQRVRQAEMDEELGIPWPADLPRPEPYLCECCMNGGKA